MSDSKSYVGGQDIADVLERAADLIEPEGAWIKGAVAKTKDRGITWAKDPDAVCFCVGGAICRIGPNNDIQAAALSQLWAVIGGDEVTSWNDAPERTQAEVVAKLREAAARARASTPA